MSSRSTWLVAFLTDGRPTGEMYVFKSKSEAFAAKDEWEREWVSSETCVVYRAQLTEVKR